MRFTNWYVITGAPCSGKTAVICYLERLGYRVVHEAARAYIDGEIKKGKIIDQIKTDESAFEHHIFSKKIEIENSLPEDMIIFLDRAVPDSIAYFKLAGLNTDEPIQKSKIVRYKKIFLFERLKLEKDEVQSEDEAKAASLDRLLEESYQMLGYDVVRIPLLSVKDRVEYTLQHL